jgi:hypothetical protein
MKPRSGTYSIVIACLIFAATVIAYVARSDSEAWFWARNILYVLAPVCSIVAGWYAVNVYGLRNRHAQSIMFIVVGLLLWFVGEVIFTSYVVADVDPFPSVADIFYVLGYPFLLIGFIRGSLHGKKSFSSKEKLELVIVSVLLAFVVIYFGVYQAFNPMLPPFDNVIAISYGIGDLLLLFALLRLVIFVQRHTPGRISMPWSVIYFGMLTIFVADILYAMFSSAFESGNYAAMQIDVVYVLGYLLIGVGFVQLGALLKEMQHFIRKNGSRSKSV